MIHEHSSHLHREFQWICPEAGGEPRLAHAPPRLRSRQRLNIRLSIQVGRIHDLFRIDRREQENSDQNVNNELHGRDIVVVDVHPPRGLGGWFLSSGASSFGNKICGHGTANLAEEFHFGGCEHDIRRIKILALVLWIR